MSQCGRSCLWKSNLCCRKTEMTHLGRQSNVAQMSQLDCHKINPTYQLFDRLCPHHVASCQTENWQHTAYVVKCMSAGWHRTEFQWPSSFPTGLNWTRERHLLIIVPLHLCHPTPRVQMCIQRKIRINRQGLLSQLRADLISMAQNASSFAAY